MTLNKYVNRALSVLGLIFSIHALTAAAASPFALPALKDQPKVLVLFDGPNRQSNPGKLDATYLGGLLGHFTTQRTIISVDQYTPGLWKSFAAVFCIVYDKHAKIPSAFLEDAKLSNRTFCWLGNQGGELDRTKVLKTHGLAFKSFSEDAPYNKVRYKNRTIAKGDVDTNIYQVIDPSLVSIDAETFGINAATAPYILHSGSFWLVADSPFSYSAENDRYLAFADILHDILNVPHAEKHSAMVRIEDLNAFSDPKQLRSLLDVFKRYDVPFSFAFVPLYVNPSDRIYLHLADKPQVVSALKDFLKNKGVPVLHGYTHQHRGITTDDYEFWDDIADKPVRGDSEMFAQRRLDEAIKEAMSMGINPLTWETPHYAGSAADYRAVQKIFKTVFERRIVGGHLGTDQFFPYPVIDLTGQYVIPETLGYIPKEDMRTAPILQNAEAALVVRDGYACTFLHPFLNVRLIDEVVHGLLKLGYEFVDLRAFPNQVALGGRYISNVSGPITIQGEGRFLKEQIFSESGRKMSETVRDIIADQPYNADINLKPGETFVAIRQNMKEPTMAEKIWSMAKGDSNFLERTFENAFSAHNAFDTFRAVVLWDPTAQKADTFDQTSFVTVANRMGLEVTQTNYSDFTEELLDPYTVLIVPATSARKLTEKQVEQINQGLNDGLLLVTDGESALSKSLGIRLAQPAPVHYVLDHYFTNQDIRWPDRPSVPWIVQPTPEEATLYYSERDEKRPLVIGGTRGQGRYLFFAPLFDSITNGGWGRFPDIPAILLNDYHIQPLARRSKADVYFDPGYRQNISIEKLAKMWKQYGIKTIHVGAWHFYEKYNYDYAPLIRVAHQNGLLVYAWFEWPHVSQRFWNQHPQWREKNALLADAHIDWRYLMNFQNADCLKAVINDATQLLNQYDWDGLNIAEFHYEGVGPQDKSRFTPFNTDDRQRFKKLNGFDPIEIETETSDHYWKIDPAALTAFYNYRREANHQLLQRILDRLKNTKRAQDFHRETVLTIIDTLEHPELADYLGIDLDETIRVANKYDVTLQVEDPAADWSKTPDRYFKLIDRYKGYRLKKPFMVDINVLPVHPEDQLGFATSQPTGSEMLALWNSASSNNTRVCLYSESSIFESDWQLMPFSMGSDTSITRDGNEWVIKTPRTVEIDLPQTQHRWILDDRPWLCSNKTSVIIPAGEHRLSLPTNAAAFINTADLDMRLLSISGELLGSEPRKRGLELEYTSESRCFLRFNKPPYKTYLDGTSTKLTVLKGDDGYTVLAPAGQHRLLAISGSAFGYFVQYTSVISASIIVLFGTISTALLFILFLFIKINRRLRYIHQKMRRKKVAA